MTEPADRPEPLEAAVDAFSAALVEVIEGDLDAARRLLRAPVDHEKIDTWFRAPLVAGDGPDRTASGTSGRARAAAKRLRDRLRGRRLARVSHVTSAEVFDRDGSRCRFCDRPVVGVDQLEVMRSLVGDEALPADGASWRSVGGTVDQVRLGRGSGLGPENLVVSCLRCRARRDGRPLADLGIADPRRRAPQPPAEWCSVVSALGRPADHGRAVLHHVLLLDGATLNIAGNLANDIVGSVADPESLRLRARIGHRSLERPIEILVGHDVGFQAHLPLDAMLDTSSPRHIEVELVTVTGAAMELVGAPGCTTTPNEHVVQPIAVVPGADRRLSLDVRRGLVVTAEAIDPEFEVVSVRGVDGELRVTISMRPRSSAAVTAARLRRRDEPDGEPVDLEQDRASGQWIVRPMPSLIGVDDHDGVVWDLWATCDGDARRREGRVGRCLSDLHALRDAMVLPVVRLDHDDAQLKLTPYFTDSRHLAIKVRRLAMSEDSP